MDIPLHGHLRPLSLSTMAQRQRQYHLVPSGQSDYHDHSLFLTLDTSGNDNATNSSIEAEEGDGSTGIMKCISKQRNIEQNEEQELHTHAPPQEIFSRHEYQNDKGNLAHKHTLVAAKSSDMNHYILKYISKLRNIKQNEEQELRANWCLNAEDGQSREKEAEQRGMFFISFITFIHLVFV